MSVTARDVKNWANEHKSLTADVLRLFTSKRLDADAMGGFLDATYQAMCDLRNELEYADDK